MDWKQILDAVDDDYLIGISNKGIVKRAYKDKEESGEAAQTAVEKTDTELTVAAGGETVKICYPLGESKCSCPSRSICRHVVLGILLAKEQFAGQNQTVGNAPEENSGAAGQAEEQVEAVGVAGKAEEQRKAEGTAGRAEEQPNAAGQRETPAEAMQAQPESLQTATSGEPCPSSGSKEASQPVSTDKPSGLQNPLWEEIKAYPLKPLLRALGTKGLRTLTARMQAGQEPEIQQTSIVTVKLQGQDIVVKLLSPLEYSSCTCHKKELCSHKAEAILWCQWKEKVLTTESLVGEAEQTPEFDKEQIKEASFQIKQYLEELMNMGLCRTSMEVVNTLERMAILAHNAELPGLENQLRALADTYGRYLRRSAAFQVTEGVGRITRLYRRIWQLLQAQSNSEISHLAGEFRAEYKLIGDLDLVGITWEHFVSQSGYEGDTYYFLEEKTKRWYTYTNARPTFYDGRKRSAYAEKAQAPWGLSVPLEGMLRIKIHLRGAKCDAGGRLSSSQETKGEIVSGRDLSKELLQEWYYDDFGKAFAEQIAAEQTEEGQPAPKRERLVFIKPTEVGEAKFEEVEQVLHMPLWDAEGRKILIEVPYSKREDATIRYLERMKEGTSPCFVGRLYLKESQLHLYPLEMFTKRELPWSNSEDHLIGLLAPKVEKREYADTKPQDAALHILEDVQGALGDLYQVGFDTVQESVLQNLRELSDTAQTYGMEALAKRLEELTEHISMKRHCTQKQEDTEDNIFRLYVVLCEYVSIGRKKIMYDKAGIYYQKEEG